MWLLVKVFAALAVYSTAVEPRFINRNDVVGLVPNLPAAWEGKQIALFADMQIGMWWSNRDAARRLVKQVVQIKPSAVLIAGDFVYHADRSVPSQMREVVDILRPILSDSIPTYAVLGNHDYELMNKGSQIVNGVADVVRDVLTSAGVTMMDNQVIALASPDSSASRGDSALHLVGIGDKWAKNDRVVATLARVPAGAPRIVFMHSPDSFADVPPGGAPLAMAGHTHGMQLGIPYITDWLWRTQFSDRGSGVEGWIDGYGEAGNRLYINRGIGFSIIPARLNAPPELTIFTLRRAPDAPDAGRASVVQDSMRAPRVVQDSARAVSVVPDPPRTPTVVQDSVQP